MAKRQRRLQLNPERMLRVVSKVVQLVEMIFPEAKTGSQKKEKAVALLSDAIELPVFDGTQAEKAIFGVLVDLVVAGFNQAEGKWGLGD